MKIIKVTLDTNILISATFWKGDSFRILNLINQKSINNFISLSIIEEYYKIVFSNEILEKKRKLNLIETKIVKLVIANCIIVFPQKKIEFVKEDPDDNKILECAIEGRVDYVITQDNHLLKIKNFEGIKIISPGDFLKEFYENNP